MGNCEEIPSSIWKSSLHTPKKNRNKIQIKKHWNICCWCGNFRFLKHQTSQALSLLLPSLQELLPYLLTVCLTILSVYQSIQCHMVGCSWIMNWKRSEKHSWLIWRCQPGTCLRKTIKTPWQYSQYLDQDLVVAAAAAVVGELVIQMYMSSSNDPSLIILNFSFSHHAVRPSFIYKYNTKNLTVFTDLSHKVS